jgi:hypothetical protein
MENLKENWEGMGLILRDYLEWYSREGGGTSI